MNTQIMRVQVVTSASIKQPRVHRFPLEEQIVVALYIRQAAPEVRADAALGVFFGERPELTRHEHTVTHREFSVCLWLQVLPEGVEDGVSRDVVRVADVVHP